MRKAPKAICESCFLQYANTFSERTRRPFSSRYSVQRGKSTSGAPLTKTKLPASDDFTPTDISFRVESKGISSSL